MRESSTLIDKNADDNCQKGKPEIIPLSDDSEESTIASDDKSEDLKQEFPLDLTSNYIDSNVSSTQNNSSQLPPTSFLVVVNDNAGMIECLSDQFSNLFSCNQQQLCVGLRGDTDDALRAAEICRIFDTRDPGTDVFSSLNHWWHPNEELKSLAKTQNRSSHARSKAKHINSLLDNWHPTTVNTILRSKTMVDIQMSPNVSSSQPDGFYDSDPGQVYRKKERGESLNRRATKESFRNCRPTTLQINTDSSIELGDMTYPSTPRNADAESFHFKRDPSPTSFRDYDIMHSGNDQYVREFVQQVTNTRLNLIWHRYKEPTESETQIQGLRAPVAVSLAFEVGTHLDQTVLQPKLSWRPTNKEPGHLKRLSQSDSDWVELLSIIRVFSPRTLNRKKYPFVRTDRSLCILSNDDRNPSIVFEAESTAQRDWFVIALKMTVARLASIIIVKDESMLMEFFSPYSALANLHEHPESHYENDMDKDSSAEDRSYDNSNVELDTNGELHLLDLPEVRIDPKKW